MMIRMTTATGWVPETDFGTRLLLARKHSGLTVREAALRCGLHYATWSTWERGARPADMASVVEAISAGLGVDKVWLIFGSASQEAINIRWCRDDAANPHEPDILRMSDVTRSVIARSYEEELRTAV
jgi:transcriptional regulator with XRE-family HTH domain